MQNHDFDIKLNNGESLSEVGNRIERVIDKIILKDGEPLTFEKFERYFELLFHSYRERCLYHLGEPCSMPDETIYPFSFVTEWKYLLETGEEYHYEKMDELLEVFDHNAKCVQQNIKKLRICINFL